MYLLCHCLVVQVELVCLHLETDDLFCLVVQLFHGLLVFALNTAKHTLSLATTHSSTGKNKLLLH